MCQVTTNHERIGSALVFRAGAGEWFNQPGKYRWDMGEDAEERPPSQWHSGLQEAIRSQQTSPRVVVVDLTEMDRIVGVDMGFLVNLSKSLSPSDTRLSVAANEKIREIARLTNLGRFFDVVGSVDEAL